METPLVRCTGRPVRTPGGLLSAVTSLEPRRSVAAGQLPGTRRPGHERLDHEPGRQRSHRADRQSSPSGTRSLSEIDSAAHDFTVQGKFYDQLVPTILNWIEEQLAAK